MPERKSSLFVVIEGIDGAGTTTQTRRVAQALSDTLRVFATREPSDLAIGRLIRELLRERAGAGGAMDERAMALLFAADRMDHCKREIAPALAEGKVVISDRYVMSSLCYQSEMVGEPADGGWIRTINQHALPADLTVYMRISAERAGERLRARAAAEERYDRLELQARLVARYDAISRVLPGCMTIDATRPAEENTAAIVGAIRERLA